MAGFFAGFLFSLLARVLRVLHRLQVIELANGVVASGHHGINEAWKRQYSIEYIVINMTYEAPVVRRPSDLRQLAVAPASPVADASGRAR